jgi:hypothetical protein
MYCHKLGYLSEQSARRANIHAKWRYRAYFHDRCGQWHVTNAEKRLNGSDKWGRMPVELTRDVSQEVEEQQAILEKAIAEAERRRLSYGAA